ncbi:MAG: response regulator [Deltaproteobacteria bacterium]|nr:response regulator [Nannocystaceae bacterium]
MRRFRLLLVEDNLADARLLCEALGEAEIDADLVTVRDGEAALAMLRSPDYARPDAVILDLNLPRMDGRELLAAIRGDAEFSELAVVVLSTSHYDRDIRACQDLRARAYVIKPAGFEEFIEVARRIARICNEVDEQPLLR